MLEPASIMVDAAKERTDGGRKTKIDTVQFKKGENSGKCGTTKIQKPGKKPELFIP